jgi:hypothetical protein
MNPLLQQAKGRLRPRGVENPKAKLDKSHLYLLVNTVTWTETYDPVNIIAAIYRKL